MLYKNLTVRELFATMPCTGDIAKFFTDGIRINNDRLAGSALEELIRRGDTDLIVEELDKLYEEGFLPKSHNTAFFVVMRELEENCREEDPLLAQYGKSGGFYSPTEWIKENADKFRRFPRSGAVRHARWWAKQYLMTEEERKRFDEEVEFTKTELELRDNAIRGRLNLAGTPFAKYSNNIVRKMICK